MREVYVVAGSFVGFQLFFSCVSPVLSSNFTQGYGKLPPNKLNDWNSRLVSTVHALIVGLFCLYILWYDDAVNEDPVWSESFNLANKAAFEQETTDSPLGDYVSRPPLFCPFLACKATPKEYKRGERLGNHHFCPLHPHLSTKTGSF